MSTPAIPGPPISFVLASASPARAKTLEAAGISPLVLPTNIDEDAILATGRKFTTSQGVGMGPGEEVTLLARAKAQAALEFEELPAGRSVLLGCDSMLEFNGEMLGKPHSPSVAFERIRQMAGEDAVLWTGHHLLLIKKDAKTGNVKVLGEVSGAEPTTVHFGDMSDEEIRAYVATGEPLEVAGSFTIDGLGGAFLRGVTGDPHSVVGVSLPLVRDLANQLGVFWPSLWTREGS